MTTEARIGGAENGHSRCFFCGERNPQSLGLRFRAAVNGIVTARFQANEGLQGYDRTLHGGVIAALLDSAMTHCLFHHGVQAVTGDLHVRFVETVPCMAVLDIRAWILSETPPLCRLKPELVKEGRIMAWAEAKFMRRKRPS